MPLLDSPRFSFRSSDLSDIETALAEVGHAVLDDLWATPFLKRLGGAAAASFAADDARYIGHFDEFPHSAIEVYLGAHKGFDDLDGARGLDAEFFEEIRRTGMPALYRRLLDGDFVVGSTERVLRRTDPKFPLRFTGLHCDGQLRLWSSQGLRTDRELTLWTPLQDCVSDDISRLLVIHRGEDCGSFLGKGPKAEVAGTSFNPIQLRPAQFRDAKTEAQTLGDVHQLYRDLFASLRCYAPQVPLGSAVLFDKDIWHGSYHLPGMTKARYSLDFRATGEYRMTPENAHFDGMRFGVERITPTDRRSLWSRIIRG